MPNEPTLTRNPKLPDSDIGWNCTSADGKICVYGRTQEEAIMRCTLAQLVAARLVCRERQLLEAIGQLAAEKLRADAFRDALCAMLALARMREFPADVTISRYDYVITRTPEEWAALALGGKEQK